MPSNSMNRRQLLGAAALAGAGLVLGSAGRSLGQEQARKKVLFFTKSSGFPHSVVTRKDGQLAHAERLLTEFGGKEGYDITCSKDGSVFTADGLKQYDAIAFYTTEDLTTNNKNPRHPKDDMGSVMPKEGPQALLGYIASGRGFIGFHCATDTFHSPKRPSATGQLLRDKMYEDSRSEFIKMIGGEFAGHGSQLKSNMRVTSKAFPGLEDIADFTMHEEWYNLMNLSDDLHVILAQDTGSMDTSKPNDAMYKRPPYPATWARKHGNGRVFYTSMGHREDVWTNPIFQKVTLAGLAWATGKTQFDPKGNVSQATPEVVTFPGVKVG
jgi:type 1 glutamine amidotransferase